MAVFCLSMWQISARFIIDQVIQIGKDILSFMWQKVLHFILAFVMEWRRGKRKFPESFHTSRGKRNCVIPKVIELAKKWSWLGDFIMKIIFQFVELSRVSVSQSNSASHKESLLQWQCVTAWEVPSETLRAPIFLISCWLLQIVTFWTLLRNMLVNAAELSAFLRWHFGLLLLLLKTEDAKVTLKKYRLKNLTSHTVQNAIKNACKLVFCKLQLKDNKASKL